jgi:molybdopterin-guanine dinucleotide biosynthesis protein A
MGRDKASLPFGDETLLQRVVRLVSPAVDEVVVVARPGQSLPPLPAPVQVTRDEVPGRGPLAGLAGGLAASTADAVYATACDVPFLRRAVVDLLFDALGDAHAAVVEAEGFVHPLAAVYRKEVESVARDLLAEGRPRPFFLFERVPTVRVGTDALRAVDPDLDTLENLNTEAAYEAALARLAARGPTVRIELYEVARRAAGVASVDVEARTLGDALRELGQRLPALEGRVVRDGRLAPHWRASVDGKVFVEDPLTPLADGTNIVLVSALAGG